MTNDTLSVANWFIDASKKNGQEITAMKLQKLVYIAYGYCLALYGRPLVREQVAVWHWGPGFRGIYDFAGAFGSGPIPSCLSLLDGCPTLREDDPRIPLLRRIWETHGKCSSSQLAQLVNETGGPWDETRRKYPDRDCVNIDDNLIMNSFKSKVQDSPTTVNTEPRNLNETVEKLKVINDTLSRNAEALADMGAILTHIGALVKKAYHRGECSVELTIYCVVDKGNPTTRKPYYITAFKLLQEFGFEVSERAVREGDTMSTLRVSWPHPGTARPSPPRINGHALPARLRTA